jgi:ABC-2 type transport system permease protein
MLWYKSWLETRTRFVFFCVLFFLMLTLQAHNAAIGSHTFRIFFFSFLALPLIFLPVGLAGSGVNTQSSVRPARGLQGSSLFTLSLPVSRFRLLLTRSGVGMLEVFVGVAAIFGALWAVFPFVRVQCPPLDSLEYVVAVSLCVSGFYFVAVVFAALIEDQMFQMWASIAIIGLVYWLSTKIAVPTSLNIFKALGSASPLFTHTVPWASIGISISASIILFFIALKIIQAREY